MVHITRNDMVFYDIQLSDGEITVGESEARKLLNKLKLALDDQDKIETEYVENVENVNVYSTSTFHTDGIVTVYVDTSLRSLTLHFPIDVFDAMVNVSGYYGRK